MGGASSVVEAEADLGSQANETKKAMADNNLPAVEQAAANQNGDDLENPPNNFLPQVYDAIDNFTSESAVRAALSYDYTDEKLSLSYKKPGFKYTTLQLAIRKSKFLPGRLVKYLFDTYIESLVHSRDDGVRYQDILKIITNRSNYLSIPKIPSTMMKEDIHGFTLLHYAILFNASAWRIYELIEPFREYLYKSDDLLIPPLHLAILSPLRLSNWDRSPGHIIKLLVLADIDDTRAKETLSQTVHLLQADSTLLGDFTPLDLAILCKSSKEIIKTLIDADGTGDKEKGIIKVSLVKDRDDEPVDYPLSAAIQKGYSPDVIEVLVDADWSKDKKTLVHVLPSFLSGELPEKYVPLVIDETIMTYLLFPDDQLVPEGYRLYVNPPRLIPNKYYSVLSTNPVMQRYFNKEWCITYSFAYLLLFEFYLYLLAVFSFMEYLEGVEGTYWARCILYVVSSVFLSREIMEMNAIGVTRWAKSPVNWLEMTYCTLILYCITVVTNQNPESPWTTNQRNTVMITGGLCWIMPLIYLRVMFRSFALFVSGCLNILLTLIPFVTSGLLLLASFAVMYQIDSLNNQESFKICYNENFTKINSTKTPLSESCPYWQSFGNLSYNVLGSFQQEILSQPTTTATRALSISFAMIAVILLLNVIIALINQKWNTVTKKGKKIFWGGRSRSLVLAIGPCNENKWNSLIEDSKFWKFDTWTGIASGILSFPFNIFIIVVWFSYGCFTFGIMWPTPIRTGFHRHFCPFCDTLDKSPDGCLWRRYRKWFVDQADDSLEDPPRKYWDALLRLFEPSDEDRSFGQHILFVFIPFVFSTFVILFWLLLGIPTFGLFWPRQVREFLFCPDVGEGKKEEDKKRE